MDLGLLRKKAIVYAAARHFYWRLKTDRFRERTVPTGARYNVSVMGSHRKTRLTGLFG